MKTSHKYSLASIVSAVIIFNFTSCKYEDGPKISLKSKTSRLVGEWEVKKLDGNKLGKGEGIEFEFEKEGDCHFTYSYSYDSYTYAYTLHGDWEWDNSKESITIDLDDFDPTFDVKRLTNSELWWDYTYDGTTQEWELEKL